MDPLEELYLCLCVTIRQFIHMLVKEGNKDEWLLTAIYANQNIKMKKQFPKRMIELVTNIPSPWLIVGDLHESLSAVRR